MIGRDGEIARLRNPDERRPVGAGADRHPSDVRPARLVGPEVADIERIPGGEADLLPEDLLHGLMPALVEHESGPAAVEKRLPGPEADVAVVPDDMALRAQRILVDGDGLEIGQGGDRLGGHAAQVVPGDERRGHHAPEAEEVRFCTSVNPGMPTIIMSGSFQRPGPANRTASRWRRRSAGRGPSRPGPGRRCRRSSATYGRSPRPIAMDSRRPRSTGCGQRGGRRRAGRGQKGVGLDDVLALGVAPVDLDVVGPPVGEARMSSSSWPLVPGMAVLQVLEPASV